MTVVPEGSLTNVEGPEIADVYIADIGNNIQQRSILRLRVTTIVISSLKRSLYSDFLKRPPIKMLYFPSFTLDELQDFGKVCPPILYNSVLVAAMDRQACAFLSYSCSMIGLS